MHIVLRIAALQGMSERLLTPLRALYARMERRFKFGKGIGQAFCSTNGIVQGCPLSVVLLNVLVNVWAEAIGRQVPGVQPACFADDTGATCSAREDLQRALHITGHFAQVTGQRLNPGKSKCWSAGQDQDMHLLLQSEELSQATSVRTFGAGLSFKRGIRNVVGATRIDRGLNAFSGLLFPCMPAPSWSPPWSALLHYMVSVLAQSPRCSFRFWLLRS